MTFCLEYIQIKNILFHLYNSDYTGVLHVTEHTHNSHW